MNIPAGVETGTRIRLSGEGEAGLRGGPTGDLYIFIEVKEHAIFQRDGIHLFCRIPVSMAPQRWVARLKYPPSTAAWPRQSSRRQPDRQTDAPARQRHAALRGGGAGDMLIELAVETPVNLTTRQRELLREFEKLSEDNNPEGSSFFGKVKGFWDGMKG